MCIGMSPYIMLFDRGLHGVSDTVLTQSRCELPRSHISEHWVTRRDMRSEAAGAQLAQAERSRFDVRYQGGAVRTRTRTVDCWRSATAMNGG
jgi:hypothetical protein